MNLLGTTSGCGCARKGAGSQCCAEVGWHHRVLRGVLIAFNVALPVAAGLWLASHGQILAAVMGIGMAMLLPIVWPSLGMRPATLLTARFTAADSRYNLWVVMGAGCAAAMWHFAILASWTLACFRVMGRAPGEGNGLILMVWAYGTVMAPLTAQAPRKLDLGNTRTLALLFSFGACVLCGFGFLAHKNGEALWALVSLTVAAAIARGALTAMAASTQRRASAASADVFTSSPPPARPAPAPAATPAMPPGANRKATKRARNDASPSKPSAQNKRPRS